MNNSKSDLHNYERRNKKKGIIPNLVYINIPKSQGRLKFLNIFDKLSIRITHFSPQISSLQESKINLTLRKRKLLLIFELSILSFTRLFVEFSPVFVTLSFSLIYLSNVFPFIRREVSVNFYSRIALPAISGGRAAFYSPFVRTKYARRTIAEAWLFSTRFSEKPIVTGQ